MVLLSPADRSEELLERARAQGLAGWDIGAVLPQDHGPRVRYRT